MCNGNEKDSAGDLNTPFTFETLQSWAQVAQTSTDYDPETTQKSLRKITGKEEFRELLGLLPYEISLEDSSVVHISGIQSDKIGRHVASDISPCAKILVLSKRVPHGLSNEELYDFYINHIMKDVITTCEINNVTIEDGLKIFLEYIERIEKVLTNY